MIIVVQQMRNNKGENDSLIICSVRFLVFQLWKCRPALLTISDMQEQGLPKASSQSFTKKMDVSNERSADISKKSVSC